MLFEPVTYQPSIADYLRINRAIAAKRMGRCMLIMFAIYVVFVGALSVWYEEPFEFLPVVIVGLLLAAILPLQLFVVLPRKSRTLFREQRSLAEAVTLTLREDGFETVQESNRYNAKWDHFVKWLDEPDMVTLFPSRNVMIWFPADAIGANRVAYIKERMIASGLPKPGKLRKIAA